MIGLENEMKIGIDIDDTLTNTYELAFNYAEYYTINELKKEIKYVEREKIRNRFTQSFHNWSDEEDRVFWDKYYETIVNNVRIKIFAKEVINQLREDGNEIYFITARHKSNKFNIEETTKKWLNSNDIKYEKIYLTVLDKAKVVKENNIDIFIDDNITNCVEVAKTGTKTYIMDGLINCNFKDEKIERIYSWPHLYQAINKYKKEIGGSK